jgi:hypothetical protein
MLMHLKYICLDL